MSTSFVVAVRVTPRAASDAIVGVSDEGELQVRVAAPPADGAANKAVLKLVAKAVGLPRSAVSLRSGFGSRHKRLRIDGIDRSRLESLWPGVSTREP